MKRVSGLYSAMKSADIAYMAILGGTKNKRHLMEVRRRFLQPDGHTIDPEKCRAEAELLSEHLDEWNPSPLKVKYFHSPGHKDRKLAIPVLDDHLYGWMLILAIQSVLMRGMHPFCVGSVPGRGIEYGRAAIERWVQHDSEAKYFVKLDIIHFYQNVNTELLKQKFRRVIKDSDILRFIDMHIDMNRRSVDADGNLLPPIPGLPIGTYTAPWMANFYLQEMDHFITEQLYKTRRGKRTNYVRHYLRNIDDILLLGASRRDLEKAVRSVTDYLSRIGLNVHKEWEIKQIGEMQEMGGEYRLKPETYPIDILGYKFYKASTTVRSGLYLRTMRTARKIRKELNQGFVHVYDAKVMMSRIGWFSHSDSKTFMKQIQELLPLKFIRKVISYADKNGISGDAAIVYCGKRGEKGSYYILYGHSAGAPRRGRSVYSHSLDPGKHMDKQSGRADQPESGAVAESDPGRSVQLSLF